MSKGLIEGRAWVSCEDGRVRVGVRKHSVILSFPLPSEPVDQLFIADRSSMARLQNSSSTEWHNG